MRLTVFLFLITTTVVGGADFDGGTSSPPMFKATKVHYPVWFMAWCGWVALKFPELIDVLQGEEEEPEIDDPDDEEQVQANTDWWKKNKRLYGAVLQAVPTSAHAEYEAAGGMHWMMSCCRVPFFQLFRLLIFKSNRLSARKPMTISTPFTPRCSPK